MRTEKEFLTELKECLTMQESEMDMAKQALVDMVTGNPIQAMRTGLVIAEACLQRTRAALTARQEEIK